MKFCSVKIASKAFWRTVYPQERLTPSEWAEKYRVLSPDESDEPGPYSFDRTPYWREVCDWFTKNVEEIVCLKGAQVGWSDLNRNLMGFCIDIDPGPAMVLMPDQKSAEDFRVERIEPLIKNTPAIGRHLSDKRRDNTKHRIRFATMSLFMVWAGSKTGTKSRPIRYLFCEEPDEYPQFSSTGGDPLAKAEKRLTVAASKGRSRKVIGGTPTTRRGNVWKRWEMCTAKMHYWVPCPHCNGYQELHWKGVKWPDLNEPDRKKRAEKIKTDSLAYYECEHCKEAIRDHHKPPMLRRGIWASEDQAVTRDGRVVGREITARRIGFFLPSTYSPWVAFSQLAEEWLNAQDDVQSLCDFVNQRLAQPFEEQREKTEPSIFHNKSRGAGPAKIIPSWATDVISTADTQGGRGEPTYWYWVTRAWARGFRSQLVDYGIANSKEELLDSTLRREYTWEDHGATTPAQLMIDSGGDRTFEVYQIAQMDTYRIHPVKGASHDSRGRFTGGTSMATVKYQKAHGVSLLMVDTQASKDQLYRLIHDPDVTRWMPHNAIDDNYADQMSAEAKVFDPLKGFEEWKPRQGFEKNNHYWDCEQYQVAAAWHYGLGGPPVKAIAAPPATQTPSERADEPRKWVERPGKWL